VLLHQKVFGLLGSRACAGSVLAAGALAAVAKGLPWAGPVAGVGVMGMAGRADAVGGSGAVGVTESGSLIRARWRLSLSLKSRLSTS
jgi:hypothetical protein